LNLFKLILVVFEERFRDLLHLKGLFVFAIAFELVIARLQGQEDAFGNLDNQFNLGDNKNYCD